MIEFIKHEPIRFFGRIFAIIVQAIFTYFIFNSNLNVTAIILCLALNFWWYGFIVWRFVLQYKEFKIFGKVCG